MDRTREPIRSSMAATTDGIPRRRHRTIGLRDSSDEGQVELQETVRLRAVASKRDRDRDSFNKNKRRRGSHREEGEQSTEESVGNEQDYELEDAGFSRMLSPNTASSASDQNHRRGFPPARPVRPTPPPWRITDEVIGVTVPRKARSASLKRSHDSWVSASCGGEEQNSRHRSSSPGRHSVEAASPSSSNVSVRKKMKAIALKTRLPKTSKSSSSAEEDIEIEIAELLYGLKTSRNQDSSEKLETNGADGVSRDSKTSILSQSTNPQTSVLPRSSSLSSYPSMDVEKKKVEDYNSSTPAPKSSTAESVKNESEQPAIVETFVPESAKVSGFNNDDSTGRETKSSGTPKEEIKKDNLESNAGYGVTSDGRSVSPAGELPSCCRLDVDVESSADARVISAVPDANSQRVEKFEIDLMASPPMVSSPERDDSSRGNSTSGTRALALDVELKTENNIKIEDKEERLAKNEDAPEEIKETKMDTFKEKRDVLKIDLDMPNGDNENLTRDKLEEKDRKQEIPPKMTDPEVKKTAQSTPVSLSTTVPAWSSSLPPPLGYVLPPLQTVVKTDKTTGSSTALQHVNFVLSPPQPKRCATHHYIARNIFLHQQFIRMNRIWPGTVSPGSLCGARPSDVNGLPTSESMIIGQRSQKKLPGVNENAAQVKKELAASNFPGLNAKKSPDAANALDSMQMKQQGPHPASAGNLMHQPSSTTAATSQPGVVDSISSASSSNKSISSTAGSLVNSSALPAVAAAMSFSYPNLAANDVPYVTIVQNNGYPFPFSTPQAATASIRGASPAPAAHMLNGPFYSSQMFHPFQHPQQLPHSQALVQPSYLNTSTSIGSSSSHKQPHGAPVNANNILSSTTMQLQQSQKQSSSQSHPRKLETETGGEKSPSVASRTSYSQKNVYGQNFTIPVQPVNFSFRPSATSDSVGGNNGNFGDKQQQALKGGVELVPSQAFAISFAAFNGTSVPSNLNFSSMAQSPVIFHSLPSVAWQGYHSAGTAHTTQQKSYSMSEGKSGGNSTRQDDEKKVNSGKSSTNGPTTLVFDNSSKNLSFVLSPTNGSWPSHSVASTALTANAPLSGNALSSQQLLQLQKQHNVQQQQPPMATRYKASTGTTSATKFVNNPSVFSQTFTQCNSSNPASHSKSSGRTSDSQVFHTSIITTTAPTLKNVSQEQGRVLQGHSQISFGGNYKSFLPPQGQQPLNNNQPLNTIFAGSPPNGSNSKTNSQGSKVGSSVNALQTQQAENSSTGTGQKSSPVCGRNVPSILTSGPSHLSELKY